MYDLDGNLLTTMEDITPECKLLLVSQEKAPENTCDQTKFRGLIDKKEVQGLKERRFDNAQEVKKRYSSINKEWTDQYYVNWVEKVQDRFGAENIEISLSKHHKN
jgi:hypothetical protein